MKLKHQIGHRCNDNTSGWSRYRGSNTGQLEWRVCPSMRPESCLTAAMQAVRALGAPVKI